jgi:hypothetical protein
MDEHHCNLGVMISTSGYKIGRGQGIAESVHLNSWKNKFHILLVFHSLMAVALEGRAPMAVLTESLMHTVNNSYANDAEVQEAYSQRACHVAIEAEYDRLFC